MLGKLFGLINKDKPATTSPRAAIATAPKPAKIPTTSLLDELTHGQSVDSITDADMLHQLVKHSDKLDKKTNRQVRERIHHVKEQEKQQQLQRDMQ